MCVEFIPIDNFVSSTRAIIPKLYLINIIFFKRPFKDFVSKYLFMISAASPHFVKICFNYIGRKHTQVDLLFVREKSVIRECPILNLVITTSYISSFPNYRVDLV
jgi:hypothetical protein